MLKVMTKQLFFSFLRYIVSSTTLHTIMEGMNNIPGADDYNSFVYIPGDFTASHDYFEGVYDFFNITGGGRADEPWYRLLAC